MKERFESMTLEQLEAINEVMMYLYPSMYGFSNEGAMDIEVSSRAEYTVEILDEVLSRKRAEYEQSDEYKAKKAESDALYASMFQPWKEENV